MSASNELQTNAESFKQNQLPQVELEELQWNPIQLEIAGENVY